MPYLRSPQDRNSQAHWSVNPDLRWPHPSVVLVTTPGCVHCARVRTFSESIARAYHTVDFVEISAVDHPELTASLKVRAAPTTIAFRGGAVVDRVVGAARPEEVRRLFSAALGEETGSTRNTISGENRALRTTAGVVLGIAGVIFQVIWLILIGAVLLASGWYDRLRT